MLKYTFGIKSSDIWEDEKHKNGGIKIYDPIDKIDRCKNAFTKFITKEDNLRPDKEISHIFVLNNSRANIELYKTDRENVTFCDEKDENEKPIVFKFGEFWIDVGDKFDILNKKVKVKMKMGGTFISAKAIYCKTGDESKITCLYDNKIE